MKKNTFLFEQLENKSMMATWGFNDPQINQYMDVALADNRINRNEMIQVLRLSTDNGVVDQSEYLDIDGIVNTTNYFRVLPDALSLSRRLFSSSDNKGRELKINTSESEMNRLVDKWFLGKDRPAISTSAVYKPVNGSLFVNGPSSNDVQQGMVGDCYLMAALASIADKDPKSITDSIVSNGDNTWTVVFVNNIRRLDYVVVDNMLPVSKVGGQAYYASFGYSNTDPRNELWVALMEKAYVQWNETGQTRQGNTVNSYDAISGGWSHVVYAQLFLSTNNTYESGGVTYGSNFKTSEKLLIDALASGKAVCVSRYMNPSRTSGHAYFLKSYSPSTGKFYLKNPWGHSDLNLTFAEMAKDCYGYHIVQLRSRVSVVSVVAQVDVPTKKALAFKAFA